MTAARVPSKRRRPPTADLVVPPRPDPELTYKRPDVSLRAALTPDDPREATLLTGIGLLGLGVGGWLGPFVGLATVGALITAIGLLAYLFPRSAQ